MTLRLKQIVGVFLWAALTVTLGFIAASDMSLIAFLALSVGCALLSAFLAYDIVRGMKRQKKRSFMGEDHERLLNQMLRVGDCNRN